MNLRTLFAGTASIAFLALTVFAATEIKLDDIKCVMNPKAAAKAEQLVEYKGGKVFFCCDKCPTAFTTKVKEDKVVAAKGNAQLVSTSQAKQEKCPFTGGDLNKETEIKVGTTAIAFCCENCQGKAKKMEGDDQIVALFGDEAFKKAGFKVEKQDGK